MSETREPQSPVADLVGGLSQGTELVGEGRFTLDPVKAREKLRAFQLSDPNIYLSLLVEAASLAAPSGSAPVIDFRLGRPLEAEFASVAFEAVELEGLLGGVFRDFGELEGEALARAHALQLLGLAVNAALALEPQWVELISYGGEGEGVGVRFGPDGSVERSRAVRTNRVEPHLCFSVAFGTFDNLSMADERVLLLQRCRYAPFEVKIDNARISRGLEAGLDYGGVEAHADSIQREVMVEGVQVGVASKYAEERPAVLLLLTRGVVAEVIELSDHEPGFRAVVNVDLRKDLSQAKVLRNATFSAVLRAVRAAHDALPDIHVEAEPEPEPEPVSNYTRRAASTDSGYNSGQVLLFVFVLVVGLALLGSC